MRPWLLAAALLGGCATLDDAGCRAADWYDVGFRDALMRAQPQDGVYASQCEPRGVKVDVARYSQGYREGRWEADARSPGSPGG
jgi:hypothetical protein